MKHELIDKIRELIPQLAKTAAKAHVAGNYKSIIEQAQIEGKLELLLDLLEEE